MCPDTLAAEAAQTFTQEATGELLGPRKDEHTCRVQVGSCSDESSAYMNRIAATA